MSFRVFRGQHKCPTSLLALIATVVLGPFLHAQSNLPDRLDAPLTDYGYHAVFYPDDFDQKNPTPLLFWFHGTSGRPNPGISQFENTYLTVGMSYIKTENLENHQLGKPHWQECLRIRSLLETQHGLRFGPVVVGGMSKGGWTSFHIANDVPEGPDGVMIFAAGRDSRVEKKPEKMPATLSVLIGVGETDTNYPQGQLAVNWFREAGAEVSYKEWLGKGHTYEASDRVLAWLTVLAKKNDPAARSKFANERVSRILKEARSLPDPVPTYLALRYLVSDPAFRHAAGPIRDQVLNEGREASTWSAVKEYQSHLAPLQQLVAREAEFFSVRSFDVPKLRKLVAHFHERALAAEDPALAARAAYATRRALKMAHVYETQRETQKTPEYQALKKQFVAIQQELQLRQAGTPADPAKMERLTELANQMQRMRWNDGMAAFGDAERKGAPEEEDPRLRELIELDPVDEIRPSLGVGF